MAELGFYQRQVLASGIACGDVGRCRGWHHAFASCAVGLLALGWAANAAHDASRAFLGFQAPNLLPGAVCWLAVLALKSSRSLTQHGAQRDVPVQGGLAGWFFITLRGFVRRPRPARPLALR